MRKQLLFTIALSAGLSTAIAQTVYYSDDFESTTGTSLPSGWDQSGAGWKSGTASTLGSSSFPMTSTTGRMLGINDDKDNADYNDQLLELPSLDLSSATSPYLKADFYYFAGTYEGDTETLVLEYSTDGGSSWTEVETVPANEETPWTTRFFDLSSLVGEADVILGFRYSDAGGWLFGAGIDNISVFEVSENEIALTSVSPAPGSGDVYQMVGEDVEITGSVFNEGSETITTFVVKYQQGSGPVESYTYSGDPIPSFSAGTFTHSVPFVPSTAETTYPLTVWVELTDDVNEDNNELPAEVIAVGTWPTKRILFEEGTGTWCGFCPRGTVAMDNFAEEHPNTATQVAVHNGDPMVVTAYDSYIGGMISGYPSMVIDRKYVADPSELFDYYDLLKDYFAFAEVTMGTPTVSGSTVTVPVSIVPAVEINNAKGLFVITESNLSGPAETSWDQVNYYSDAFASDQGSLEGWDDQPYEVPNTKYHFVARYTNNPAGSSTDIPSTMEAGETYNITLTAELGSSWTEENLQYSFTLLDEDGIALNSSMSATPSLLPVLSISNTVANVSDLKAYPNPASSNLNISFGSKTTLDATISVVNILGQEVYRQQDKIALGNNVKTIDVTNLTAGTYFVNINTNEGEIKVKFVKH